ncbi:MAG: hypothetical protein KKF50_05565 [Nanoarchaeota archaeon]|nr:hypothetical protein [Nanoarchaeota archaeon]
MKKVFVVLMFLMLVGGALAMTSPIRIQVGAGNDVRLNARDSTTGVTIGNYKDVGIADENGLFETRIYSLLDLNGAVFHVKVYSGLTLLQDKQFDASEVSEPLLFDCTSECFSSTYEYIVEGVEPVVGVEEELETVDGIIEESTDETIEGEIVVDDGEVIETGFSGMAIFVKEDGSINWVYSVGAGVVVLLLLIVLIALAVRHSKKGEGKEVALDDEEKELEDMEEKVKETENKIKKVKEKKDRRIKIYNAKIKLAEEERELKELEEDGDKAEVEKQEEVVEKAEDKVDDAIEQN